MTTKKNKQRRSIYPRACATGLERTGAYKTSERVYTTGHAFGYLLWCYLLTWGEGNFNPERSRGVRKKMHLASRDIHQEGFYYDCILKFSLPWLQSDSPRARQSDDYERSSDRRAFLDSIVRYSGESDIDCTCSPCDWWCCMHALWLHWRPETHGCEWKRRITRRSI